MFIRQQPQLQFLAQVGSGVTILTDSKDDPSSAAGLLPSPPSSEHSDGVLGGLSIKCGGTKHLTTLHWKHAPHSSLSQQPQVHRTEHNGAASLSRSTGSEDGRTDMMQDLTSWRLGGRCRRGRRLGRSKAKHLGQPLYAGGDAQ